MKHTPPRAPAGGAAPGAAGLALAACLLAGCATVQAPTTAETLAYIEAHGELRPLLPACAPPQAIEVLLDRDLWESRRRADVERAVARLNATVMPRGYPLRARMCGPRACLRAGHRLVPRGRGAIAVDAPPAVGFAAECGDPRHVWACGGGAGGRGVVILSPALLRAGADFRATVIDHELLHALGLPGHVAGFPSALLGDPSVAQRAAPVERAAIGTMYGAGACPPGGRRPLTAGAQGGSLPGAGPRPR